MKMQFMEKIGEIIEYTTQLSFPMFVDEQRKHELILVEKEKIDSRIDVIVMEYDLRVITDEVKAVCWDAAVSSATGEFVSLPDKLKINSFYLQEVFHNYTTGILAYLKDSKE